MPSPRPSCGSSDLHADAPTWARMQKNAMATDVGWDASAPAYAALYEEVARA